MNTPSIYVGTFAKYNAGSLFGEWLNPQDYGDAQEFYTAAAELHKDEDDPELMFQDWEHIPDEYISECSISQEFWDRMDTINSSYLDAEVFDAASALGIPTDRVEELYQGEHSSDEKFAYELADEIGAIDHNASWPMSCIDWELAARELMMDYGEADGHYFRTSY